MENFETEERRIALRELCSSLRENDPETTLVNTHQLPTGYGFPLGNALMLNTLVTHLSLRVSSFFDISEGELTGAEPMLTCMGASPHLETLDLWHTGPWDHALNPEMMDLLYGAVAANPHITTLDTTSNITCDSFATLVQNTRTILHLKVQFLDYGFPLSPPNPNPPTPVIAAFGANQSLEKLSISDSGIDVTGVLQELATHPKLMELRLGVHHYETFNWAYFPAIANLLNSSRTLVSLVLDGITFNEQGMAVLLAALSANTAITCFGLLDCKMDVPAKEAFVNFMQTTANKGENSLRDFYLAFREWCSDPFEGEPIGKVAASLLLGSSLEMMSFGGAASELHQVEGTSTSHVVEFLKELTRTESQIALQYLELGHVDRAVFEALEGFVVKTCRLETLNVRLDASISTWSMVPILRRNGSLRCFATNSRPRLELIKFCRSISMRNGQVPDMLAAPRLRNLSHVADETEDETDLELFPTLFDAAQQAPRTGPNAMFAGLLATMQDVDILGPIDGFEF